MCKGLLRSTGVSKGLLGPAKVSRSLLGPVEVRSGVQDHVECWLLHESRDLPTQLEGVYAQIERTWRATSNYTRIAQYKQKDGEDIYEYAGRLEEVFKAHGGLPEDAEADSPYQSQLKDTR